MTSSQPSEPKPEPEVLIDLSDNSQELDEKQPNAHEPGQNEEHGIQNGAIAQESGADVVPPSAGKNDGAQKHTPSISSTGGEFEEKSDTLGSQDHARSNGLEELSEKTQETSIEDPPRSEGKREETIGKTNTPPLPPPKDEKYLGVTAEEDSPNGKPPNSLSLQTSGNVVSSEEPLEQASQDDAVVVDDSRSEIQSIMDQFEDGMGGPGEEEIMSPRLEKAGPLLSSPYSFPPRRSSLEPIKGGSELGRLNSGQSIASHTESLPPRSSSLQPGPPTPSKDPSISEKATPPEPPPKIYKPPQPAPDPDPDLPFDFHRFLEQLRHRTADPVAKFLRSFLFEFGKKQWMVHEQVKIISDFLEFISKKMAQCDVWRTVSDAEFDNAREGMEKLVMNRLYSQCFSPAIPAPEPIPEFKGKQRKGTAIPLGPGRRGQHQEDVERDEVLAQKVSIYGWVREEHLDIKPMGDKGRKFLKLAQQELLKVNSYRAPRDKVICVLNSCKVIFGFLRSNQADQSADSFVPLLIYTVLQANPKHLVSNVQYILRFRNQEKLGGEAGYYISSLMGAIQFIESLDRTSLTVTDVEFEKNVEAAVSAIAERHSAEGQRPTDLEVTARQLQPSPQIISEKSALSRPEVTPRNSLDAERIIPNRSPSRRNGIKFDGNGDGDGEENAAVAGLLRTIQRPLSTIGRIFSDESTGGGSNYPARAPPTPQRKLSPVPPPGATPRTSGDESRRSGEQAGDRQFLTPPQGQQQQQKLSAEDAAALQASAEVEQARRLQRQEHQVVVETLRGMFPALDREVIDDVVRMKEGRVGAAVDACLALSN